MEPPALCPVCGRAADLTGLLVCVQLNHLRCLHDFAEAQATYYAQCHHYMQELQRELSRSGSSTLGHLELDSSDVEGNDGDSFVSLSLTDAIMLLGPLLRLLGAPTSAPPLRPATAL